MGKIWESFHWITTISFSSQTSLYGWRVWTGTERGLAKRLIIDLCWCRLFLALFSSRRVGERGEEEGGGGSNHSSFSPPPTPYTTVPGWLLAETGWEELIGYAKAIFLRQANPGSTAWPFTVDWPTDHSPLLNYSARSPQTHTINSHLFSSCM